MREVGSFEQNRAAVVIASCWEREEEVRKYLLGKGADEQHAAEYAYMCISNDELQYHYRLILRSELLPRPAWGNGEDFRIACEREDRKLYGVTLREVRERYCFIDDSFDPLRALSLAIWSVEPRWSLPASLDGWEERGEMVMGARKLGDATMMAERGWKPGATRKAIKMLKKFNKRLAELAEEEQA